MIFHICPLVTWVETKQLDLPTACLCPLLGKEDEGKKTQCLKQRDLGSDIYMYVLKGVVWKESPNRGNPRSEKSAGKKSNRIKAVWFAWLSKKTKKVVFLQKPRRAWCLRSISLGVAYTSTKEACQLQYEIWNLWESDFFRLTHPCIPAPMTITNEWKSWNQRDQRGGADFLHNPGNLSLKTRPAYIWTKVRGPLDSVMILLSKCRSPKVALVDSWLYMTPLFAGWSAGKTARQVVLVGA